MSRTKGSGDLFRLIHSLTKEERGYFKKFGTRHSSESIYLEIFNAIHKQEQFEEASLKRKFKNYTVLKVYLFEAILQSLMIYKQQKDVKIDLHYQSIYIHILTEKNLLAKARQFAQRAAEKAEAAEIFSLQYEFLKTIQLMDKNTWKTADWLKKNKAHFDAINKSLDRSKNAEEYRVPESNLYFLDMARITNQREYGDLDKLVDLNLLTNKSRVMSHTAERARQASLARYYALIDREDKRFEIFKQTFKSENELLKKNRPLANKSFRNTALLGLISGYLEMGQPQKAEAAIDKEWIVETESKPGYIADLFYYTLFRSHINWALGKHIEGEGFIEKHFDKLKNPIYRDKYQRFFVEISKLRVLFAYSNDNLQKAMININEMQSLQLKNTSPMYYKGCEFLKALVQIKFGNYDIMKLILSNLLKSKYKTYISPLEKQIMQLFKSMDELNRKQKLNEIQAALKSDTEKLNFMSVFLLKNAVANLATGKKICEMDARG